jgi:hypothetical protein
LWGVLRGRSVVPLNWQLKIFNFQFSIWMASEAKGPFDSQAGRLERLVYEDAVERAGGMA